MEQNNKFYVTTPIYYVTAKPHVGSLYSTLLADIYARWERLRGKDVFFLTGMDEHGQKVAAAAAKAGKEPHAFVDSFVGAFHDAWQKYELSYNYFIRTTDPNHKKSVQAVLKKLLSNGDIYKSVYKGWYCTPCETFVTEKEQSAQIIPECPACQRPTQQLEEETYFFRLSAYQDKLLAWYESHPDFIIPHERGHEVISFVKAGLHDISVSRTGITWGVPFPHDEKHVAYVWIDALINYISALGYGQSTDLTNNWWPANVQVLGKDIVRFHAVIWPAVLMALDLRPPRHLLVHGWLKIGEQKMSKSLGNVVEPMVLAQQYGVEAVRYYLARYTSIAQDSDFNETDLVEKYNADIANGLSNLLHRMTALAEKFGHQVVAAPALWSEPELHLRNQLWSMLDEYEQHMNAYTVNQALSAAWRFVGQVNSYVQQQEPWLKVKNDPERFKIILSAVCHSVHALAIILTPVVPKIAHALLQRLGASSDEQVLKDHFDRLRRLEENRWTDSFILMHADPVAVRKEMPKGALEEVKKETPVLSEQTHAEPITIDEFARVHLVVGTILQCEDVPGSSKLWRLQVDCGTYGKRQILSGIKAHFEAEQLRGRQAVFIVNLPPRKLMNYESHGMLLVAHDQEGRYRLITPSDVISPGARLT